MISTFSYSIERIQTIGAIWMMHCIDMVLQYFIIAYLSIADPIAAINMYGVCWLTRVCKVACRTGQAPKQWRTSVIKPIHKQGWEKSIVIDIRYRYSLLFVHRMHWSLYFFE